ncbi:hypothetical protein C8Z91_24475 [Paenibacillus elgii]|uniref:Amidohydrolase-related domain-containing protein n=1 Tax=Paenibacillus elgii TaxID=189691 RepID=A0A2T6FXA7_9BACL|nr:hypothetical protein C8Z91_24475 [Paenibacillus elgii]
MGQLKHDLFEKYKHLKIIDVHNHDADYYEHKGSIAIWEKYHVDKTVLFGAISEPAAMKSDELSWKAYVKYPTKFFPFFRVFRCMMILVSQLQRPNLKRVITE